MLRDFNFSFNCACGHASHPWKQLISFFAEYTNEISIRLCMGPICPCRIWFHSMETLSDPFRVTSQTNIVSSKLYVHETSVAQNFFSSSPLDILTIIILWGVVVKERHTCHQNCLFILVPKSFQVLSPQKNKLQKDL